MDTTKNHTKNSLIFYEEWDEAVAGLPVEMRCAIYEAIHRYAFRGEIPQDPYIAALTAVWRNRVDKDRERYENVCERNRANVRKRWAKKSKAPAQHSDEIPTPNDPTPDNQTPDNPTPDDSAADVAQPPTATEQTAPAVAKAVATVAPQDSVDTAEMAQLFNTEMASAGAVIPRAKRISGSRARMLKARIREYGRDTVVEVFRKAARSDFLNGSGGKGFVANLSWLMCPDNFLKTLEGAYDNHFSDPTFNQSKSSHYDTTSNHYGRNESRHHRGATQDEIAAIVFEQLSNPYYTGPDVSNDY